MAPPTIGEKVRHMRSIRGLTVARLSEESGVPPGTIHDLETNRVTDPKISTLTKLAAALKVDVHYFIDPLALTPLQFAADHIPEDLRLFIIQAESMPYLQLAQKADLMGLPPKAIESVLSALYDSMRRSRER